MTLECPYCNKEIESDIEFKFWNTKTVCPECNEKIIIEYDFYCSDDGEDFPVYTPVKTTETTYSDKAVDYVISLKIDN